PARQRLWLERTRHPRPVRSAPPDLPGVPRAMSRHIAQLLQRAAGSVPVRPRLPAMFEQSQSPTPVNPSPPQEPAELLISDRAAPAAQYAESPEADPEPPRSTAAPLHAHAHQSKPVPAVPHVS